MFHSVFCLYIIIGLLAVPFFAQAQSSNSDPTADGDAALVARLIKENIPGRQFSFAIVVEAASEKKVLPFEPDNPVHKEVFRAITAALDHACAILSRPDSPARGQARINEVSRFFEDSLRETLDAQPGLEAGFPVARDGRSIRSGYPDLRIVHKASGLVFYLDPKLVNEKSWQSSFRTFYFEPTQTTIKINDDAVHFLAGIPHNGDVGQWVFGPAKLVDLAQIKLRLKPEFQASNKDIYSEDSVVTEPEE